MFKLICGFGISVVMMGCASMPSSNGNDKREEMRADMDGFGVGLVLEQWHFAAGQGLFDMYFGLMTDDSIFLGTDEAERWTKDEFKGYAREPFADGHGWTYVPRDRFVSLADDGMTAWVDEVLDHDRYGTLRGTAVMQLIGEDWKIAHYSLTMLVPNEKMGGVVEVISREP